MTDIPNAANDTFKYEQKAEKIVQNWLNMLDVIHMQGSLASYLRTVPGARKVALVWPAPVVSKAYLDPRAASHSHRPRSYPSTTVLVTSCIDSLQLYFIDGANDEACCRLFDFVVDEYEWSNTTLTLSDCVELLQILKEDGMDYNEETDLM
jgi:hypothetical protein